jgi:2-polyprenyl-3-methyl-5-hydroxy-6-metoxy-1,4-benzoquinol methylase
MSADFPRCEVCGEERWRGVWKGKARAGSFGSFTAPTEVRQCESCGVQRLAESACKDESFYASGEYRQFLGQGKSAASFHAEHDPLQLERLNVCRPHTLRGRSVADIGCAGGSFLDHVRGLASATVAIEPAEHYHAFLAASGYHVFPSTKAAHEKWRERIERAFSFSVIEHVAKPRAFLAQARELLAPEGTLLVSTPNRADFLMDLLPQDYPGFFYRSVHRWYFDRDALARCAEAAGLKVADMRCVHRFGLGNALGWLRDRRPPGRTALPGLDDSGMDGVWRAGLEREFRGDYLYATLVQF